MPLALVAVLVALGLGWWLGPGGADPDEVRGAAARATAPNRPTPAAPARLGHARDPDPTGTLRLEGLVLDEANRPVAGALVEVGTRPRREVITESDGSFAIEGLLPRTYGIRARKDDRYATKVRVPVRATTEPLILRMVLGSTLALRVIDDVTEAAVAGARVDADDGQAVTGPDGIAELRGLGPWFQGITVRAAGYAPAPAHASLGADPGGRSERTVRLVRGARLSGTVVGPGQVPVAGARVEATSAGGDDDVETDANGAWRMPVLGAGSYRVTAAADGLATAVHEIELDGVTARDGVQFRLETGRQLQGVVVDAAGAPVAQADVAVHASRFDARHVTTGADGRFAITGLARATLTVIALHGNVASAPIEVDLREGPAGDLRLALAPAMIAGVVVDPTGAPVPEARVGARRDGVVVATANGSDVADAAGRFEIGPLAAGEYRLRAEWPGTPDGNLYLTPEAGTAAAGASGVRLTLAPAGSITGTVQREGAPVGFYGIAISQHEGGLAFAEPELMRSPTGRFLRGAVPPGTYVVRLVGTGFAPRTFENVEVTAGATTDLGVIAVEPGSTIRGRVVDEAARPVAGASVFFGSHLTEDGEALTDDGAPLASLLLGRYVVVSGPDGRFEITGIEPPHRSWPRALIAQHRRRGRSRARAVTPPAEAVVVTLVTTGVITGIVRGGPTLEGLVIRIASDPPGGYQAITRTDAVGRFRAPSVPAGAHIVTAEVMRGASTSLPVEVDVTAGATVDIELTFGR